MDDMIKEAARILSDAKYAVALTGAGISTESGIQDYRGPKGVWTLNPDAERNAYKSYDQFIQDPEQWWENVLSPAGGKSPGIGNITGARPNSGHYILAEMENMGVIKCTITQNVDSLHEKAGTKNLIEYHGSMAKLRCMKCGRRFSREMYDLDKLRRENNLPPLCIECRGILKTDGVFFGEPIPKDVVANSIEEAGKCDCMLICGTSAVVFPFASLPRIVKDKGNTTIVEVNAEPTPLTTEGISDIFIEGKLGEILPRMLEELKYILD